MKKESAQQAKSAKPALATEKPKSMSENKKIAMDIKKSHKNIMWHAFLHYSDDENYFKQQLIATIVEPLHRWHSKAEVELRATDSSMHWLIDQCKSSYWQHLLDIACVQQQSSNMRAMGMDIDNTHDDTEDTDGAHCASQDAFAEHAWGMTLGLLHSRLRWGMDYLEGWPRRSCLLVPASGVDAVVEIAVLREQLAVLKRASADCMPILLKKMASNSHLMLPPAQQIIGILEESGWNNTVQCQDFCRSRSKRLLTSQPLEDAFNRQKARVSKTAIKRVADETTFWTLIDRKVLEKVHHFQRPSVSTTAPIRDAALNTAAFRPQARNVWPELRKIIGPESTPRWHHPGANHVNASLGDLHVMRALMDSNTTHKAKTLQTVSKLLNGPNLMVRCPGLWTGDPWVFVLGPLSDCCYIGWPAVEVMMDDTAGHVCYELDTKAKTWCPVVLHDIDHWMAMEYKPVSPMHQQLQWPASKVAHGEDVHVRVVPTMQPDTLLRVAASKGFWALSRTWAVQMAKDVMDCEVEVDDSLFDVIWKLVQHQLKTNEEQTLAICKERLQKYQHKAQAQTEDLMDIEPIKDELCKEERKKLQDIVEAEEKANLNRRSFKSCLLDKRKVLQKARKVKKVDVLKALKVLAMVPENAISQTELRQMCPPGGSIWNNWKSGSWCGHLKPYPRHSAPWAVYGHREAALLTLRRMWKRFLEDNGMDIKACPVKKLFTKG